jgi:hypothetical protein
MFFDCFMRIPTALVTWVERKINGDEPRPCILSIKVTQNTLSDTGSHIIWLVYNDGRTVGIESSVHGMTWHSINSTGIFKSYGDRPYIRLLEDTSLEHLCELEIRSQKLARRTPR